MTTQIRQAKTVQIFVTGLTVDDQNSAPGSWAYTSRYLNKQANVSGCVPKETSPGRMQVMAVLNAFQNIFDNYKNIALITNSSYIQKIIKHEIEFQANKDLIQNIYQIIDEENLIVTLDLVKPRLSPQDAYYHEFGYLNSQARKQIHRAEFMNNKYNYPNDSSNDIESSETD